MRRQFLTFSSQEEGAHHTMCVWGGHTWKYQRGPRDGEQGKCEQEPLLWFLQEGMGEEGTQVWDWLA